MTKRQKTLVEKFILEINRKDREELKVFTEKLHKSSLDRVVFDFTLRACEIRKEELGETIIGDLAQKHITYIEAITDQKELRTFRRGWYMSKPDLDTDTFNQVKGALDTREDLLIKPQFSVMAESSELRQGEL